MSNANLTGMFAAFLLGLLAGFVACWFFVARPAMQEAERRGATYVTR